MQLKALTYIDNNQIDLHLVPGDEFDSSLLPDEIIENLLSIEAVEPVIAKKGRKNGSREE